MKRIVSLLLALLMLCCAVTALAEERVVILKQWKKPETIYKNLMKLNKAFGCNMTHEDIYKVAHSSLGLYRRCGMDVVNYLLSQKVLAIPNKKENRPGLVDPLAYYLRNT